MFSGYTGISLSVRPCVCVLVCAQTTTFCEGAGGDDKVTFSDSSSLKLSSAVSFSLEESKICRFGKG